MVRIDDDFVIDVDSMSYTAKLDRHKTTFDKKTNTEVQVYDIIGYYSTLEGAMKGIIDYKVKKLLSEDVKTLEGALKCVVDTHKEFTDTMNKVVDLYD